MAAVAFVCCLLLRPSPTQAADKTANSQTATLITAADANPSVATSLNQHEQVVAYVGTKELIASELESIYQQRLRAYAESVGSEPGEQFRRELKRQVVQQRLDELVLLQAAREDIPLAERRAMWKKALTEAHKKLADPEDETLEEDPVDGPHSEAELKLARALRDRMLLDAFLERRLPAPRVIARDELRHYYFAHRQDFRVPETATFRAIQLGYAYFQDQEEAVRMAEQVRRRALAGEDFGKLVADYSLGPMADSGGYWKEVKKGELKEPLNQAVFSLPVGQVSDVIRTDDAAVLVRVEKRLPGFQRPFEDLEVQHQIRAAIRRQQTEEQLNDLLARLRRQVPVVFIDEKLHQLVADQYRSLPGDRSTQPGPLRKAIADYLDEELDPGLLGKESDMMHHPLGPALLAAIASLASTPAVAQVLIKGQPQPLVAEVLEEGKDYVVLRVPRDQIQHLRILSTGSHTVPSADGSVKPAGSNVAGSPTTGPPLHGTWREDDHQIIITINGREVRLAKQGLARYQSSALTNDLLNTGSVQGRLLHRGRPLAGCAVKLVPMRERRILGRPWFTPDGSRSILQTRTDNSGLYLFENVPEGQYKLFWRPKGTNEWIRRVQPQPDVLVKSGKKLILEDVHQAIRTIN